MDFRTFAVQEAQRQGVDPALILSMMGQESSGQQLDPRTGQTLTSPKGALGLMQLMPPTARELGVNPEDPYDNIRGGVRYMRQQLDAFGSPELALAAYNAGPKTVRDYGGIPPYPETQNHVRKVMGRVGDADIFGQPARQAQPSYPADDSDIFGSPSPPPQPAATGAHDDSDIFADRPQAAAPAPKWTQGTAPIPMPEQRAEMGGWDVARDVAKSGAKGLQHGVGMVAGAPSDLWGLLDKGWQQASTRAMEALGILSPEKAEALRKPILPDEQYQYGSQGINRALDSLDGGYKPKTMAGEYAKTAGEFIPGTLLGAQTLRQAPMVAAKYGLLPGVTSETAGQLTKGTELEPWARAGTALGTMGLTALLSRPNQAKSILGEAISGVDESQLAAAERLMADAAAAGTPITAAEAIQQVTNNGTTLGNIQRVAEASQAGGAVMKPFFSPRGANNDAAVRSALDGIAPATDKPYGIAPRVQKAAEEVVQDAEQVRKAAVTPSYTAANPMEVPADQMSALLAKIGEIRSADKTGILAKPLSEVEALLTAQPAKPAVPATRTQYVDGKVQWGRPGAPAQPSVPITDIENLDRARKYLRDKGNLPAFAAEATPKEAAGTVGGLLGDLRTMMETASEPFAAGRQKFEEITHETLHPLYNSPTGLLAKTGQGHHGMADAFNEQTKIILNPNPLPNSEKEIAAAVKNVAFKDQQAARDLVRTHLEQVFNETTQRLVSGENQWGGAKYASVIAGNPQQAKNLEAALRALPNGDQAYGNFRRVLDVLEAQGTRQPTGSQTEFNRLLTENMKAGGKGEIGAIIASPAKAASFASKLYENFRYGQNTAEIARMLTSPDAIAQLRPLAMLPANSAKARALVIQTFINTNGASRLD